MRCWSISEFVPQKKALDRGPFLIGYVKDYLPAPSSTGAGVTLAEIVMRVCSGTVFALIVTVLVCLFFFPLELNLTSISPTSPGAIGSLGHWGTVQPQDPLQRSMMSGLSPVLVNLKMCVTASPSSMVPKSHAFSAKEIEVEGPASTGASAASAAGSILASGAAVSAAASVVAAGAAFSPASPFSLEQATSSMGMANVARVRWMFIVWVVVCYKINALRSRPRKKETGCSGCRRELSVADA